MPDIFPLFAAYTAGAFTGWFGHFWTSRRDAKNRVRRAKDEFFAILAQQKTRIEALHRETKLQTVDEDRFFCESRDAMCAAVYTLQHFLTPEERTCMHTVLKDYQ